METVSTDGSGIQVAVLCSLDQNGDKMISENARNVRGLMGNGEVFLTKARYKAYSTLGG